MFLEQYKEFLQEVNVVKFAKYGGKVGKKVGQSINRGEVKLRNSLLNPDFLKAIKDRNKEIKNVFTGIRQKADGSFESGFGRIPEKMMARMQLDNVIKDNKKMLRDAARGAKVTVGGVPVLGSGITANSIYKNKKEKAKLKNREEQDSKFINRAKRAAGIEYEYEGE